MNKVYIILTIVGAAVIVAGISLYVMYFQPSEDEFDAIDIIKDKMSLEQKHEAWYSEWWTQEKVGENLWEVSVADATWKVGKDGFVCSKNELARTYSDIDLC